MSQGRKKRIADETIGDLWPGQSEALLKALGILTASATLTGDARRKLKQVLHLIKTLRGPIDRLLADKPEGVIADLGAGKSYLGLMLYDIILREDGGGRLAAVEARADLADKAARIAADSGFDRARFITGTIAETRLSEGADIVTALHACDTATDEAIEFALAHGARVIALVPCCQAELARQLEDTKHKSLDPLWRHPMERRDFGSGLTNVIRGLYLEAKGYKVRVTELTGWEHSLKNELILAERHQLSNPRAAAQLERLLAEIPVRPSVLRLEA